MRMLTKTLRALLIVGVLSGTATAAWAEQVPMVRFVFDNHTDRVVIVKVYIDPTKSGLDFAY
jgi:hypothetical protein